MPEGRPPPSMPARAGAARVPAADARRPEGGRASGRRLVWLGLALVLLLALGLRLWGIRQGLPYAYNSDEDAHFVPRAIGMLTLGWNPHYFANPPAYTDLLRLVFAAWFGGRAGVSHTFAVNPTAVFTLARVCAALLGTLAVWLLYIAGARLFDRGVALLAAALEAVAFLPVFYSHLALNDVPTLAPLTLSLLGTAGVLRKGRARDYLIAGVGLGLGCATKYTAGIVLLPLLAAAGDLRSTCGVRPSRRARRARGRWCRPRARRRRRAGGLPGRRPLLGARLPRLRAGPRPPVLALRRSPGQARRAARERARLLPVDAHLGPRLGARARCARRCGDGLVARAQARLGARAGAAALPALHGLRGPLLRALAAADLPDPLPARRLRRAAMRPRAGACRPGCSSKSEPPPRSRLGRRSPSKQMPPRRARGSCWSRSPLSPCSRCARRGSCTASTRGSCSRAPTPAPSRARGWSRTCPSARRWWSSRSCPTSGCRTSATPRSPSPDGDRWLKYHSLLSRDRPDGGAFARRRPRRSASKTTSSRSPLR